MPDEVPGETTEGETAAEEEQPEGEKAEGEGQEAEGPVVPTHEPFSFEVLRVAQTQQSLNGLRHNDHLRYRQYCSRRLRRLFNVLRFKHGRVRYKAAPFPENFDDARYLEIPLVAAERAWSYAVQLKADNAAASAINARWRHHSITRLSKAVKWGQILEAACKVHADQRTQLEAEAYLAFLEGSWMLEKEEWADALAKLKVCRRICDRLALASGLQEGALYKAKVQELGPMVRECKYNLGRAYDDADTDEDAKPREAAPRKDLSELSYRGQGLAIPSDRIKAKLVKCLQLVQAIKVDETEESAAVIEKYGQLSAEFSDALKDIHTDMINAGSDATQAAEWNMLEAFARELSISMNVERNLVLLSGHLGKLDGLEEVASSEARKSCRPEEGMRFCDLLREDLGSLRELPESSDAIAEALGAYSLLAQNCRCFFLAMCYNSMGKALEAASLMDMLQARVDAVAMGAGLPEPLGRLHPLFERVQQGMPTRVARWRCRGLAQLCSQEAAKAKETEEGATAQKPLQEFATLAAFPPRFRDIPCKPLLFDLAFPSIQPPDVEELLPQKQSAGQKSLLGRVAGGLTNRLGGLWGRK